MLRSLSVPEVPRGADAIGDRASVSGRMAP
ncbi:hypothetical protein SUDANB106_03540 [Streptomyces sp. enrichment culture]